jgi:hypothetical protein
MAVLGRPEGMRRGMGEDMDMVVVGGMGIRTQGVGMGV